MAECPFAIMTIPERKKPCLFWRRRENELVKIGQLDDAEAKKIFVNELNAWISRIANETVERILKNDHHSNDRGQF